MWRHIESHTTKDGVLYRGNAMADKCAADACGDPRCPALTSEGAYTFWRDMSKDENRFLGQLWHISGDLRASLKSAERSALLAAWQDKTTAGKVTSPGLQVPRYCVSLIASAGPVSTRSSLSLSRP